MDMNKHMLIFFSSYPCWWIGEKEVVIKKEMN
jgi:hypothetical protein